MQWAALSASQSEPSFSLGRLSLHCAGGMPLTHNATHTHSHTHTYASEHKQTHRHTRSPLCQYIITKTRGSFKKKKSGGMTIAPSSRFPTLSSNRPPLRLNLNVKWDWLDYGGVKWRERQSEKEERRKILRRCWGRAERWGALDTEQPGTSRLQTHWICLYCTRFLTVIEAGLVWDWQHCV